MIPYLPPPPPPATCHEQKDHHRIAQYETPLPTNSSSQVHQPTTVLGPGAVTALLPGRHRRCSRCRRSPGTAPVTSETSTSESVARSPAEWMGIAAPSRDALRKAGMVLRSAFRSQRPTIPLSTQPGVLGSRAQAVRSPQVKPRPAPHLMITWWLLLAETVIGHSRGAIDIRS